MSFWVESGAADDASWILRMRAGDEAAFTALYRRHAGPLFRFALRMSGNSALAEDAVQDAFMALVRSAGGGFDPERGTLSAYLYGIVRRQVFRHLGAAPDFEPLEDDAAVSHEVASDPLEGLTRREQAAQVRLALEALPAHYREVVVLCDLEEVSYAAAADYLNCAVGTVRSRLSRARAMLWGRLQHVRSGI